MSTTTAVPVEAGTTYPMPPAPSWATGEPDLCEGSIGWDHDLSDPSDPFHVSVWRRDWIQPHSVTVGKVEIHAEVENRSLTVEQAHRLATLLELAADFAGQS
jgi:hypothetical protein